MGALPLAYPVEGYRPLQDPPEIPARQATYLLAGLQHIAQSLDREAEPVAASSLTDQAPTRDLDLASATGGDDTHGATSATSAGAFAPLSLASLGWLGEVTALVAARYAMHYLEPLLECRYTVRVQLLGLLHRLQQSGSGALQRFITLLVTVSPAATWTRLVTCAMQLLSEEAHRLHDWDPALAPCLRLAAALLRIAPFRRACLDAFDNVALINLFTIKRAANDDVKTLLPHAWTPFAPPASRPPFTAAVDVLEKGTARAHALRAAVLAAMLTDVPTELLREGKDLTPPVLRWLNKQLQHAAALHGGHADLGQPHPTALDGLCFAAMELASDGRVGSDWAHVDFAAQETVAESTVDGSADGAAGSTVDSNVDDSVDSNADGADRIVDDSVDRTAESNTGDGSAAGVSPTTPQLTRVVAGARVSERDGDVAHAAAAGAGNEDATWLEAAEAKAVFVQDRLRLGAVPCLGGLLHYVRRERSNATGAASTAGLSPGAALLQRVAALAASASGRTTPSPPAPTATRLRSSPASPTSPNPSPNPNPNAVLPAATTATTASTAAAAPSDARQVKEDTSTPAQYRQPLRLLLANYAVGYFTASQPAVFKEFRDENVALTAAIRTVEEATAQLAHAHTTAAGSSPTDEQFVRESQARFGEHLRTTAKTATLLTTQHMGRRRRRVALRFLQQLVTLLELTVDNPAYVPVAYVDTFLELTTALHSDAVLLRDATAHVPFYIAAGEQEVSWRVVGFKV